MIQWIWHQQSSFSNNVIRPLITGPAMAWSRFLPCRLCQWIRAKWCIIKWHQDGREISWCKSTGGSLFWRPFAIPQKVKTLAPPIHNFPSFRISQSSRSSTGKDKDFTHNPNCWWNNLQVPLASLHGAYYKLPALVPYPGSNSGIYNVFSIPNCLLDIFNQLLTFLITKWL